MKNVLRVPALTILFLVCAASFSPCSSIAGDITDQLAGRWMICDDTVPGAPAALEISGDGFVNMLAIKSLPLFSEKDYDQWLFKPVSETEATAKSPGGDVMSMAIEKAGREYLLEIKMEDTFLFLYRSPKESEKTGFEGTWNMPALPILDFEADGVISFPGGNPVGPGDAGMYRIMPGNRIAISALDKQGVENVLVVLKPAADLFSMKLSGNEDDYKEAGDVYEKPAGDMEQEPYSIVKGPAADFFYQQPMIAGQVNSYRETREQQDFHNCGYSLDTLSSAQESYFDKNEKYASEVSQLDMYTYECEEMGECDESLSAKVDEYCLPGSFKMEPGYTGDWNSYRMTAQTKDVPACNICRSDQGWYPETFEQCPNEDVFCGY